MYKIRKTIFAISALAMLVPSLSLADSTKDKDANARPRPVTKTEITNELRIQSNKCLSIFFLTRKCDETRIVNITGRITSIEETTNSTNKTFEMEIRQGLTIKVMANKDTPIRDIDNKDILFLDLKIGNMVLVRGEWDRDNSQIKAESIKVIGKLFEDKFIGKNIIKGILTSISDSTITIKDKSGIETTLDASNAKIVNRSREEISLSDLSLNDRIWTVIKDKIDNGKISKAQIVIDISSKTKVKLLGWGKWLKHELSL